MSWSFRKDCIGLARSLFSSQGSGGEDKLVHRGEEEDSLNFLLCILIAYFVSTVSHDVDEWLTWGVPFVHICVEALELESSLTVKLRDRFIGTVGSGFLFVFDEVEEDGWTGITPLPSFLSDLSEKLVVFEKQQNCSEEEGVQKVLDEFLSAIQKAVTMGKFDTRTRVLIGRRICTMMQVESTHHTQFLERQKQQNQQAQQVRVENDEHVEKKQENFQRSLLSSLSGDQQKLPISTASASLSVVVPSYRTGVQPQQMVEAVNSFRALKIGVAAASGGALMFLAGGMAAPCIMTSLLSSLTGITASSSSTIFLELTALLNTYGLPVITSAATTLGTTVASLKMMRRTDPLKEFVLEPLHAPHTTDLSRNTILVDAPSGYRKSDTEFSLFRLPQLSLSAFKSLLPPPLQEQEHFQEEEQEVFLLLPGHFSGQKELRELWGGDQDLDVDDDERQGAVSGAHGHFRFTLRSVDSSFTKNDRPTANDSAGDTLRSEGTMDTRVGLNNIRNGWWRDVMSSAVGRRGGGEPYVVRWDTAELIRLYNAQLSFLLEKSVTVAVEEMLKIASPVIGAAALPLAVLERAAELDCPWLVAMDRAEQAGRLLAAVLLENAAAPKLSSDAEHQQYRQRAVNLIGYGFGARVIFHCALLLAAAPDNSGMGIIQDVVLLGAPVSTHSADWRQIRKVVSGRLVNCFKRDDWMLGLMYRSKSWEVGVAGLGPVRLNEDSPDNSSANHPTWRSVPPSSATVAITLKQHDPAWRTEVENVDVGDLVSGHLHWGESLQQVLHRVNLHIA